MRGTRRIILLNNTESPFWDAARAGIAKAAEDLKLEENGFTAGMDSNTNAEEGQIEKLRQYGTQSDIAAVIISPTSATNPAIADELKKLKEKGIIIGTFDSDLDENSRAFVSSMSAQTTSAVARFWEPLQRTLSRTAESMFSS